MKILVAGDFCPSYRINDFLQKNNFKGLFGNILNHLKNIHLNIL